MGIVGEMKLNTVDFNIVMKFIIDAIAERDYDPYMQLCGYLKENNPIYITSHKNARALIQTLDKKQIEEYIARMK